MKAKLTAKQRRAIVKEFYGGRGVFEITMGVATALGVSFPTASVEDVIRKDILRREKKAKK